MNPTGGKAQDTEQEIVNESKNDRASEKMRSALVSTKGLDG